MFFAEKWNSEFDWSRSRDVTSSMTKEVCIRSIGEELCDKHGNRAYDLSDVRGVVRMCKILDAQPDGTLVSLPFDQQPGCLKQLIGQESVRNELREIYIGGKSARGDYACIHIRRGDCTKERHPEWYVNNDLYKSLIEIIAESSGNRLKIIVCTQGTTEYLEDLVQKGYNVEVSTTSELFLNKNETYDFGIMAGAKVLIAAGSQFSWWAGVVGNSQIAINITRSLEKDMVFKTFNPDREQKELENYIRKELLQSGYGSEP